MLRWEVVSTPESCKLNRDLFLSDPVTLSIRLDDGFCIPVNHANLFLQSLIVRASLAGIAGRRQY